MKYSEWNKYARLPCGFNDTDIELKVADPSVHRDTLSEIREAADRANGAASCRTRTPTPSLTRPSRILRGRVIGSPL